MIIFCDRVVFENGIRPACLKIENGKFTEIKDARDAAEADRDLTGYTIIPGIFDTHNHGCFGYSMIDGTVSENTVKGYLKGLAASGVTNVFPTVIDSPESIGVLSEMADHEQDGAKICGIHSEGPWGSRVGEKGVNTGYPAVDLDRARLMVEKGKGKLKLVDVAPEVDKGLDAIRYFVSQGITVGMYHTNANAREANAGVDAGATVATHLGNVMTGMHHRDVGTLGTCLLRDEVDCEVICDGMHICLDMIRIYFKAKDYSRFMMISDNVAYAGLPAGRYSGWNQKEGSDRNTIIKNEEGYVLSLTGRLSGSSQPVLKGIKNLVTILNIPFPTVCMMASLNPSRKYGFPDKGSIKEGKDADFVILDDDFNVIETYSEGRKVFDHNIDVDLVNHEFLTKHNYQKS